MTTAFLSTRQGPTSDSRSFSNNHYPPSQRSKVSIGIVVDKTPNVTSGARQEDKAKVLLGEKLPSFQGKPVCGNGPLLQKASSRDMNLAPKDKISIAWVSTRSVHCVTPDAQTVHFFPNQDTILQLKDEVQKRSDCFNYDNKKEIDGSMKRVDKTAVASIQETDMLSKGKVDKNMTKVGNDTLRLKLWEILGSAPLQNKQTSDSQVPKGETADLVLEQHRDCQNAKIPQARQSDTIETNSESLSKYARRPVTRSLARKRDPKNSLGNFQLKNSNEQRQISSPRSECKRNLGDSNVFSFDEPGRVVCSNLAASNTFSKMTKKSSSRNASKGEPCKISFPRKSTSFKSLQAAEKEQAPVEGNATGTERYASGVEPQSIPILRKLTSKKTIAHEKEHKLPPPSLPPSPEPADASLKNGSVQGAFCPGKPMMNFQCHFTAISAEGSQNSKTQHYDSPISPILPKTSDKNKQRDDLPLPENCHASLLSPACADGNEHVVSSLSSGNTQSSGGLHSPTLAINTSRTFSKEILTKDVSCSPTLAGCKLNARRFSGDSSSLNSRLGYPESDTQLESSRNTRGSSEAYTRGSSKTPTDMSKNQKDKAETEHADDLRKQALRPEYWTSDAGCNEEPPVSLRRSKRFRSLEGFEDTDTRSLDSHLTPPLVTSKTEETNGSPDILEELSEDTLPRAISQLAMVLERFKTNIRTRTTKKKSEILSSVGERIHLQLQDIESQIQEDVRRFTGIAKSKRKRLESTFQEQQQKLKGIHEKFKEEVNQHLLDCKGTLEELEAFQMELKGNAERQRASHRKLLEQVEAAMEVQLRDAESKVTSIHKVASKNMKGLKLVLGEWLNTVTY